MSDEQDIINAITSHFAALVSFTADNLKIDGGAFGRVADAIRSGDITVDRNALIGAQEARYDHIHDQIILGTGLVLGSPYPDSLIVHECVHAISDIGGLPMKKHFSEAVGYIAQTVYLSAIWKADFANQIRGFPADPLNDVGRETVAVARRHGLGGGRHVLLSRSDLGSVIRLVRKVDLYSAWKGNEKFAYDGV